MPTLTFQAMAVLRGIRKMMPSQKNHFVFSESYADSETVLLCLETGASYDYARYAGEIDGIIDMLEDEKCISVDRSGTVPVYQLTELGMHPYQLRLIEIRDFIINSILVPIAVSAITTLVTLWLTTR